MEHVLGHSPVTALMAGLAVFVISQFAEKVAANFMAAVCKFSYKVSIL
jgi:hypothetical protein